MSISGFTFMNSILFIYCTFMYSIRNPYLFQNGVAKIIQPGSVSRLWQPLGHSPGLQGLLPQLGHGIVKLDAITI